MKSIAGFETRISIGRLNPDINSAGIARRLLLVQNGDNPSARETEISPLIEMMGVKFFFGSVRHATDHNDYPIPFVGTV